MASNITNDKATTRIHTFAHHKRARYASENP
jgi:hypothetical protein